MKALEDTSADRERLRGWVDALLDDPGSLPVSFGYGGHQIQGIPAEWSPMTRRQVAAPGVIERVWEGRDPASGLDVRIEAVEYAGHPVVEWTGWLSNRGSEPSEIIDGLLGLDASFAGADAVVEHCNGDFYSGDGYTWERTELRSDAPLAIAPRGGRPCDGAFPYFRLLLGGGGLAVAVGWPGQWEASMSPVDGGVRLRAGQQGTHLRLQPGETVRTPRIALLAWNGEKARGVNLWRRWFRDHVMPRPAGSPLRPLLSVSGTDEGEEFTGATAANQLEYQRRYAVAGVPFDVWWIDAGWYPCDNGEGERRWTVTGSWYADPDRFPDGLSPVGTSAAGYGARLLLWFEPERVFPGTELAEKHPEWVLTRRNQDAGVDPNSVQARSGLLDLANPACRQWLIERVSGLITEYAIGIYRQDFNFAPLGFWRDHDDEERRGITENLHVQGYLDYWDSLLERHPGLMIDSCASGGRRNDLETLRRSVPLHYTDYGYGLPATKLDFHRTLYEWIPFFRETNLCWDIEESNRAGLDAHEGDAFSMHCAMAPMLSYTQDITSGEFDFGSLATMTSVWRRMADLLLAGDYYPLTAPDRSDEAWVAWQFHRPDGADGRPEGAVQAVRLSRAPADSLQLCLQGLDPDARYLLEEAETGRQLEMDGAALAKAGLVVTLPPRAGSVWFYREAGS